MILIMGLAYTLCTSQVCYATDIAHLQNKRFLKDDLTLPKYEILEEPYKLYEDAVPYTFDPITQKGIVRWVVLLQIHGEYFNAAVVAKNRLLTKATCVLKTIHNKEYRKIEIVSPDFLKKSKITKVNVFELYYPTVSHHGNLAILEFSPTPEMMVVPLPTTLQPWPTTFYVYCVILVNVGNNTIQPYAISASHELRACFCLERTAKKRTICGFAAEGLPVSYGWAGAPLVCKDHLVGILDSVYNPISCNSVSFGFNQSVPPGTNQYVFTYLCPYTSWIYRHTKNMYVDDPWTCRGASLSLPLIFIILMNCLMYLN